jgi:hypothetical protein
VTKRRAAGGEVSRIHDMMLLRGDCMKIRLVTIFAAATLATAWTVEGPAQHGGHFQHEQRGAAFSDNELRSFAVAVAKMRRINETYRPRVQTAATAEERMQVQQTASAEMTRAVETEGMTIDKFHYILTQTRDNPEVAQRVRKHLEQQPR